MRPVLLLIILCLPTAAQTRHTLVIGIDGARSDAVMAAQTPNMDNLLNTGAVTWNAVAGGALDPGDPTHQDTSSGPGWSSLLIGVWADKHDVHNNGEFSSGDFTGYPHFFKRVRDYQPGAYLSSIVQWHPINQNLLHPYPGIADFTQEVADSGEAVKNAAVAHLASADPTALFLHFDDVDHAGHASGFHPGNPAYLGAIADTDAHIGDVLAGLEARPNYQNEDWLVLITTDHGGNGVSHGGHTPGERRIWIIAAYKGAEAEVLPEGPGHTAVARTALAHLQVPVDPTWGLEDDDPFGLPLTMASAPRPTEGAVSVGLTETLDWLTGADALAHDVYFGTQFPPSFQAQVNSSIFDPGILQAETTYYWQVDTVTASGTLTGEAWTFTTVGTLFDGLAMHLDFQGDLVDETGQGLDGNSYGNPKFQTGLVGQAIRLDGAGDYFSFGSPPDLDFGADTDFSVAFWVRSNGWSSDPVMIGNKDWGSGANTGWLIAGESDGTSWQWNFKGSAGSRVDFDLIGSVADLTWHHIAVTHDRDGDAVFYQDGVMLGAISIAGQGDLDAGLPTVVGQDGTLNYPVDFRARIDELRLWRRVIGPSEVYQIYSAGLPEPFGDRYCVGMPNSAGAGARLIAVGSPVVANNDLTLVALGLPPSTAGFFYFGTTAASVPLGEGVRCVGGAIKRFLPPVVSNQSGVALRAVDLTEPPAVGSVFAGASLYQQLWYRDPPGGPVGYNFSDGLLINWE
ncbi:MAG TPA: hypothetical protein EYQ74_01350 [Planctomycetes bacterium]|nr:hypothetical protein [Planctomycetota bacterium]